MPTYDLHKAAREGTLNKLPPEALTRAAMLAPDADGSSPLYYAASNGHLAQVHESLRTDRAAMLAVNLTGDTPLYAAVRSGHIGQVAETIRSDKAAMLTPDTDYNGDTPLHAAATLRDLALVPEVIRRDRAAMLTPNTNGITPLHIALSLGDYAQVPKSLIGELLADTRQPGVDDDLRARLREIGGLPAQSNDAPLPESGSKLKVR